MPDTRRAAVETDEPAGRRQDAVLLAAARAVQHGDTARFEEIYRLCFAPVYAMTRSLLRDTHEAEDAVQETFLSALRALPRYRPQPGVPFIAWLLRIARNAALMRIRRSKKVVAIDPGALAVHIERGAPEKLPQALSDGRLADALAALPMRQRQVLALRFVLDLDGAETAVVMDTSPAAVRQLQRRALSALSELLVEPQPAAAPLVAVAPLPEHEPSAGLLESAVQLCAA